MSEVKKNETSQIGGKGTIRRKKKCNSSNIKKISQEEMNYNAIINRINKDIKTLKEEEKELFEVYVDDWLDEVSSNLKKKDFKKGCNIELDKIKENCRKKIMTEELVFIKDYSFYSNMFSIRGYEYFIDSLEELDGVIKDKDFVEQDNEEIDNINYFLKILDLDTNVIPSETDIRRAYLKKSNEFHPDKHPDETEKYSKIFEDINKANTVLKNYYNERK